MKYTKNLHIEGNNVISYTTHVATIDQEARKLYVHGYWSQTTSKHINYVASLYNLEKVDYKESPKVICADRSCRNDLHHHSWMRKQENEGLKDLKRVAMVMQLGNIFGKNQQEQNDWKTRMLKAGLENKGLIMPEDWEQLDENEKEKRLNGAIEQLA